MNDEQVMQPFNKSFLEMRHIFCLPKKLTCNLSTYQISGSPNILYLKDNTYHVHNSKMRKSKEDRKVEEDIATDLSFWFGPSLFKALGSSF